MEFISFAHSTVDVLRKLHDSLPSFVLSQANNTQMEIDNRTREIDKMIHVRLLIRILITISSCAVTFARQILPHVISQRRVRLSDSDRMSRRRQIRYPQEVSFGLTPGPCHEHSFALRTEASGPFHQFQGEPGEALIRHAPYLLLLPNFSSHGPHREAVPSSDARRP